MPAPLDRLALALMPFCSARGAGLRSLGVAGGWAQKARGSLQAELAAQKVRMAIFIFQEVAHMALGADVNI